MKADDFQAALADAYIAAGQPQAGLVIAEDLAAAEEAFRIAEVRYREGVADYETVLQAQDDVVVQPDAVIAIR